ncbi:hypothetical protein ABFS83_08G082500 [Erythranthe nasuta]
MAAEQVEKMVPIHQEQEAAAALDQNQVLLLVGDQEDTCNRETDDGDNKVNSLLVPEPESPPSAAADEHAPPKADEPEVVHGGAKFADLLPENEKKALMELEQLIQEALNNREFGVSSAAAGEAKTPPRQEATKAEKSSTTPAAEENDGAKTLEAIAETIVACAHTTTTTTTDETGKTAPAAAEEVSIWGVKLLEDERSDVVLHKFLRARDFKAKDAFAMIKNTVKWRKQFGIDGDLVEDDDAAGELLGRAVFMHGHSKEGNPVCYNVYGEFQDKDLYRKMFSDEEKRSKFLKWRIQFLEKSARKLDFRAGGVSTIIQVNDLKNSPGPNRWELRQATNQALQLFQDNYPEFVAKQVFINVPLWYLALSKMISPFMTQRTKSKFVVARPSTTTETLFKYIAAEQIPTQYGGLSKDGEFGASDSVTEVTVKPSAKHIVEFPVTQGCCVVSWEASVVGWEVRYGAEFVPSAENGYTIIIQKMRKINNNGGNDQVIRSNYRVGEPGKLILTIANLTSRKKKLLYRFKTKLVSSV